MSLSHFKTIYQSHACGSFIITPCTEDESSKIMSEFNNNKATDIDSIRLRISKLAKQPLAFPIIFLVFLIFTSLQVFFQKDLKQQRLHQFSKRVPNFLNAPIIDQFCHYLI